MLSDKNLCFGEQDGKKEHSRSAGFLGVTQVIQSFKHFNILKLYGFDVSTWKLMGNFELIEQAS